MTPRVTDSSGRPISLQCRQGVPQGRDPVTLPQRPGLNLSKGNPTARKAHRRIASLREKNVNC